ncbi:MAG: VanW family protein [Anaerolineae bacterium]|jgi:vancomycin resistance protein YoaR
MKTRGLAFFLLVLVSLVLGSVLTFEAVYADRIYPGISIWGADVGGLLPEQAVEELENHSSFNGPLITLQGPDRSWSVGLSELGLELDPASTLAHAFRLGREHSWSSSLLSHLELLARGANTPPVIRYDESVARRYLEALTEQVDIAAIDAELTFNGTTPVVRPSRPGRRLDVDATLASLSPVVTQMMEGEITLVMRQVAPAIIDAELARAEAQNLLNGPLTLTLADPREGDPGPWVIPPEQLLEMLAVQTEDDVLHTSLDQEALRVYLEKLAPALVIDPVDARFHFNETSGGLESIAASQEGRALDVEASVQRIVETLATGEHHAPLQVKNVPPRYPDSATAEELGIVDRVAEGESYFIGSPSGRDHNIRLAATKFDGLLIPPGETFSFNQYLGEVTAEAGYDESYITAGEQLEMGIGGGICQVSTTAFRAAFWGGYPITERWYHSQRVSYYELRGGGVGMDATVYSPHVDLKFVNDREAPLLIETEVGEASHRLVFRFYSTDDGRRVEKEGPEVSDEANPGPPIYELDEDLSPGTVIKWQSEVGGLTATIERWVYNSGDDVLHHDTFVSKYAPRRAAYHYGPGYEPPEEETEP